MAAWQVKCSVCGNETIVLDHRLTSGMSEAEIKQAWETMSKEFSDTCDHGVPKEVKKPQAPATKQVNPDGWEW